jgi:hypothetical protein
MLIPFKIAEPKTGTYRQAGDTDCRMRRQVHICRCVIRHGMCLLRFKIVTHFIEHVKPAGNRN